MHLAVSAHTYGLEAQSALVESIARSKTLDGQFDPLAPVTIVVPSSLAGYHIRRSLGRRPRGMVNVQVRPLQALLELIGSTALIAAGRRPLPDVRRYEAIRSVAETGPSVFGDVPIEGGVLRTLTQRFTEFDDCDRAQLDTLAGQGGIPAYLVDRYDAYRAQTEDFYTHRDLADSAIEALQQRPNVLRDIGSVIVYLPGDLNSAGRAFLQALAEHTRVEVILGLTGDVEAVDRYTLERWGEAPDQAVEQVPTAQQVVQSPDAEEEVRSAIREISASLLSANPTPLHRTAILYRQPEPYQRICAEQLDAAGLTWNGRNSETLGQSIAGRTLDGLLGLMSGSPINWSADVAPWLAAAPIRAADGSSAPTARWNQLARRANLQRGPGDWPTRLQRYRATCLDDLKRLQRSADESKPGRLPWVEAEIAQIDALAEFVGQLVSFTQETPAEGRWSDFAGRAREQLTQLLGDREHFASHASGEDDLELARWDDVQTLLTELSWLDDLNEATAERFVSAARRGLEKPTGHHGRLGDGIFVGHLSAAAGMHWDVVYIVGAAEKSMPQIRSEDPLLSDQLRARASLQGASDYMRRERADYLAALHSAERRVLSYPRADVREQRARLPGRWLLESASELNAGERIYASKVDRSPPHVVQATPSFEQSVVSARMPADTQEFDLRSIRETEQPQRHYLATRSPSLGRGLQQQAERWRRELTRWDGLIADGAAATVARPHSAGALQDWATCPYRYFLGRILRIEERDDPRDELQITPLDKGSLIHEILEQFFKQASSQPAPGQPWSDSERERLADIAGEKLDEARDQGLTGRDLLWRRDRRRILDDLQTLLDEDDVHRNRFKTRQVDGELAFGELPESKALVGLTLHDGSVLKLRGMIDRVDQSLVDDQLIVIDYKTGREFPPARELAKDVVVGGRFLQLPVYAHAARQVYGLTEDATVQSAYWYITERGEFKYNPVEWDEANTSRFEHAINLIVNNVRAGRFPANPGGDHPKARAANCALCSFDAICPVDRRRHWDQIKLDPQLADYVALSEGAEEDGQIA